jgi:hypothetical protein
MNKEVKHEKLVLPRHRKPELSNEHNSLNESIFLDREVLLSVPNKDVGNE